MADILNIQMPNSDRDLHIIAPIVEYLEYAHGLKVASVNVNNAYAAMLWHRPKLVLMANPVGQAETLELLRAARGVGVKTVTIVSEGNFQREQIGSYFWGWNEEHVLAEDIQMLWNQKGYDFVVEAFPETRPQLRISGATGFDRYKLLSFMSKDAFLKSIGSPLKKVVGIAGWGSFTHLLDEEYLQRFRQTFYSEWSDQKFIDHRWDLAALRKLYRQLVIDNPDTLFILRMHPQAHGVEDTEFAECEGLPNAYISNQHVVGQPRISDVISASDVWLAYESGTAIEAWMLGKQTFLINPRPFNDLREETAQGSPIVHSLEDTQAALDTFFATGVVPGFAELADKRDMVVARVVGFTDGKSHVRGADHVMEQFRIAKRPGLGFYRAFPWKRMIWQLSHYLVYGTWLYRQWRGDVGSEWFRADPQESDKVRAQYRRAFRDGASGAPRA